MATSNIKSARLLDAVASTGAGNYIGVSALRFFTFNVIGTGVTSGATIRIEAQDFEGNVVTVTTFAVTSSANATQSFSVSGVFNQVRANITARTDGTYTVRMDAAPPKLV
jgi:hypothetical protein